MVFKDLRQYIGYLKQEGELLIINDEMDKDIEVPGMMRKWAFEERPALLFNNIRGYKNPIISNILGTYRRLALALGVDERDLINQYLRRRDNLLPPKLVEDGPVKEVIIKDSKIENIRQAKTDVDQIKQGVECGITFKPYIDFKVEDWTCPIFFYYNFQGRLLKN